jgi:hypothetical protein
MWPCRNYSRNGARELAICLNRSHIGAKELVLSDISESARAEIRIQKAQKKEEKQREIDTALAQYRAEVKATEEKTARLRAARLAKEAADREAAVAARAAAPVKKVRAKKSGTA